MRSFLCTILQSCFEETKQIKDIFSIVLKLKNKKQEVTRERIGMLTARVRLSHKGTSNRH